MPALNGSYTATLSPTGTGTGTGTESFVPAHTLSSSIASLGSSTSARSTPSNISKTYRQASTLFLTRRLPEALSTVQPLITPTRTDGANGTTEPAPVARASRTTRIKVWTLYIAILNAIIALESDEGKEAFGTQEWRSICTKVREGEVWEEVIQNGYHGVEGDVDSDVVINLATLLLTHARTQELNQKRLENFLAASTMPIPDLSNHFSSAAPSPQDPSRRRSPSKGRSGADTPRDLNARVKILELYTLHVLLRNNEWDYAREFISVSSVLDDERREAFLQALQSLQEDQQEADRMDREEKQRQEGQLRRDIEEARKLRAENEEHEKRRLEEERHRREGSEIDYGVDTSSVGGSSKGRRARTQTGPSRPHGGSTSKAKAKAIPSSKSKAVVSTSFGSRAATVISNLRAIIERMSASFQTNPMLLMRFLAFLIGLALMFGKRNVRERIARILGSSWNKVKATAGMGVKVSYI